MKKLNLKELNRISIESFKQLEKTPVAVVLDNVRSALNVGAAFRTGDAFAISHLYLCGITAQPPHREILKTAIGATEAVDWSHHPNTATLVLALKDQGYQIIGVEQANESIYLQDMQWKFSKPIALVFGNEVEGIQDSVMALLDGCIEIPQIGTKHSLNIAVSLGIVLWEAFSNYKFHIH